jgi:outer membrane lipoprotein-sorting protein
MKALRASRLLAALAAVSVCTTCPALVQAEEEGAKSLYAAQMNNQSEAMNLGVQYWIELHRGKQTIRVNNKLSFKSGDKIRFHVRPNINGYAYILLRSGSRGEQSVLFPDPARGESNKVVAGIDYSLPSDDFLQFDDNPGQEKLTLLVSRTPVDATAYLRTPETERILVASAMTGSKDLVPSRILLAYAPQPPAVEHTSTPAPEKLKTPPVIAKSKAIRTESGKTKIASTTAEKGMASVSTSSTKVKFSSKSSKKATTQESKPSMKTQVAVKPPAAEQPATQPPVEVPTQIASNESAVTIVKRDPSGVLAIDIALDHD